MILLAFCFLLCPGTRFIACSTNSGYCSLPVNSSFLQVQKLLPHNYSLLSNFALFLFISLPFCWSFSATFLVTEIPVSSLLLPPVTNPKIMQNVEMNHKNFFFVCLPLFLFFFPYIITRLESVFEKLLISMIGQRFMYKSIA